MAAAQEPSTSTLLAVSPSVRRPRANTIADTQPSRTLDSKANTSRDCSSGSFVTKLFKMVDTEPAAIVSWIRGGTAFCIVDPKMMAEHCLPKYFRHRRFSSLIRQLNFYSFYRVQEGQLTIYQHSFFRKGRPDLLVHIKRRGAGKAKDPWFDPLNAAPKPPMPMNMNGSLMVSHHAMDTIQSHSDMSIGRTNAMLCYSPLAKPLANSIDNMSPALKPGLAHAMPPVVELGGSAIVGESEKFSENQRWENHLLDLAENKTDYQNLLMKPEQPFDGELTSLVATSSMLKSTASSSSIDIDIQDFLTDDCAINAVLSEKEDRHTTTTNAFFANSVVPAKRALVARDCLKWETKTDETPAHDSGDDDAAFEQELLLDLANVEPGAWEVPLSPLADEEDVMPWLDLCF